MIGQIVKRVLAIGVGLALVSAGALPSPAQSDAAAATKKTANASAAKKPAKTNAAEATVGVSNEDITALKSEGVKSAPITLEVFSDFECPACKILFEYTLNQVSQNYVSTNRVYLIHRDFPLPMHKYSREAARYANAAARIGKFDAVASTLFARQETWATNGQVDATVASVLTPAEMAKVRQLEKSSQIDAGIQKDVNLGNSVHHVTQTPTTIITYKGQMYPVVGVVTYPILKQFLDSLLAR